MSQTHQALVQDQRGTWVDEVLDGTVTLLDMGETARDIMLQMKENVKDLQSALPRRNFEEGVLSLSFMSTPMSKPKVSRWQLVSKLMKRGVVSCESEEEKMNEVASVDVAIFTLCHYSSKDALRSSCCKYHKEG
ncbi:PREDICTED: uncharacterized protein LOC109115786 [Nelumbo nucifera]|uniref:Uncharacterized protein n=2 Tax=Nelumbo nucifera TaxID=4432 RepID=A0A822ZR70_NELNU|nr:PREDICTED: uncharacterized protein LOC109115786 [Nelumbo nucifera]DAD46011.1 TPA_asm: hypothetical protein HUJ06_004241 [Nelumbo nucifera]